MKSKQMFTTQMLVFVALVATSGLLFAARHQVANVLGVVTGTNTALKAGRRGAGRSAVPVIVAPVTWKTNTSRVAAIGTARARRSVTLYPAVSGEVMQFKLRAGDRVKRNVVILHLDDRQAILAVRKAEAKKREAETSLARARALQRKKIVSKSVLEDALLAAETAEIELRQAKEALADHSLRAPFQGVVGIPKVEAGDRVTTTTEVITLDDRSEILVEFDVPERYLAQLKRGLPVTGQTPGFPGRNFTGKIDRIDSRVAPESRSVKVRAVFSNAEDLLRPGMSFVMELKLGGGDFPTVPELALQWRKGESYVWMVEGGAARKVVVRTVKRLNGEILVDGKLSPGDLVVVEGVQRLRPNRKVKFEPPEKAPRTWP